MCIFCTISCLDKLLFIINLGIQSIEIFNETVASEWNCWFFEIRHFALNLSGNFLPFLVEGFSIIFILLDSVDLLLLGIHFERLIKCEWIDLLQDGLECNQGLLKNLMPMVLGQFNDDWNQHWECLLFVSLQDVEEVVILEEAHCSIRNLEMDTTNASNDSLEKSWDQVFNLVNFTYFKNFLEFSQEESFFDAVCKRPILEKTFKKWNSHGPILG